MSISEDFEQFRSAFDLPSVRADSVVDWKSDNGVVLNHQAAQKMPTDFPDVTIKNDPRTVIDSEHGTRGRGNEIQSSPPADLPGLPPPSHGHRQIVHLTPGRYIDIPYPEDYSIKRGITYGHVTVKVPGWVPGSHPYR